MPDSELLAFAKTVLLPILFHVTEEFQNGADRGAESRSVLAARERFSDEEQRHSGGSGRT